MPHFHLSFQSGNDRILSLMRRRYTRFDEDAAVDAVYRAFPDACISADLICGFPSETEEEFLDSVSLARRSRLLHAHVFPYSKREGTAAARMTEQLDGNEKKRRCALLSEAAYEAREERIDSLMGREYSVLAEICRDGKLYGHTENFIYTCAGEGTEKDVGGYIPIKLTKEAVRDGEEI